MAHPARQARRTNRLSFPNEGLPPLIAVVGPTASGKSGWAMELGERFGGEIVNTDSMQVYRHFDIGTSKPSPGERERIPHHLIDVADPDEDYFAGRYVSDARNALTGIVARGRLPILCGGTGLYFRSLLFGLAEIPDVPKSIQSDVEESIARKGAAECHKELAQVDPISAAVIHPNDPARVARALAVYKATGRPLSTFHRATPLRATAPDHLSVGIQLERETLYRRINDRVRAMLKAGWLEEVRDLLEMGCFPSLKPMRGIGYRELARFLKEGGDLEEVTEAIATRTRHYAKRQLTWFRKHPGVHWLDPGDLPGLFRLTENFLEKSVNTS